MAVAVTVAFLRPSTASAEPVGSGVAEADANTRAGITTSLRRAVSERIAARGFRRASKLNHKAFAAAVMPVPPAGRTADRAPEGRSLPLWPLSSLFLLYPVWWALGINAVIFIIMAVPMVFALSQRRPLRVPPGFWLWALFLLWVVVGVVAVNLDVPGTLPVSGSGRYLSYGLRLANYVAVTVVMLYVGNLTEQELPRLRLLRWMSVLFLWTVLGGLAGTFFPSVSFTSPIAGLVPAALKSNEFVGRLLQPSVAQVQDFLGYDTPRASAPFEYTNAWGNNYSLLLIWFVVAWLLTGGPARRALAVLVLLASVVPVVSSLNRGLWVGLCLSALYLVARMITRGSAKPVAAIVLAGVLAGVVLIATPLGQQIETRLATPHSDQVRASLSRAAFEGALLSPVMGWGSGRALVGSERSATIGKTPDCPRCGNRTIGSQGQFWLMIFAHGFPGAFFYCAFFAYTAWHHRRDHSFIGIAGGLAVLLPLFYMLVYNALVSPLCLYLVSVALLWRNADVRKAQLPPLQALRG
jgi:hypothetical protein